jgi:hypothetical protein
MIVEQRGDDCLVAIGDEAKIVKNCNAMKLACTLWNKDGEKYTPEEMHDFGFQRR